MRENKQLGAGAAMALAVAALVGASAFAESRPSEGTRSRGDARATVRRGTVSASGAVGRGNESRNRATVQQRSARSPERRAVAPRADARTTTRSREGQTYERRSTARTPNRSTEGRTYERRGDNRSGNASRGRNETYRGNDNRRGNDSRRGDSRWNGNNGNRNNRGGSYNNRGGSNNNRRPYYHRGRISNYHRYGGGYRVWIAGSAYPFYVPLAYWHPSRFRVGLSIGLGGYYNSAGYYDYYDGYRDGVRDRSYDNNLNSEADFRGVVESVDWRRDTFVVRNEVTGNFVTVVLRDRREGSVREGDYVAVRGDWTTRGVFHAYDVDLLD